VQLPVSTGAVAEHSFVRVAGAPGADRVLAVIPGLNDPLKRVGDARWFAGLMAGYVRRYRGTHAVYMLSRPRGLAGATSTAGMADAYAPVLRELAAAEGVDAVDCLGLSLGGFVVQHLAADHADVVDRAVLGLAGTKLSAAGRDRLARWREHAEAGRWRPIYLDAYDVVVRGLQARALQAVAVAYDLVAAPSAPADFLASVDASVAHDGAGTLETIDAPTLVLGGTADPFFDEADFRDAAERIPDSTLAVLHGLGHEAVVEHGDAFDGTVKRFFGETRT